MSLRTVILYRLVLAGGSARGAECDRRKLVGSIGARRVGGLCSRSDDERDLPKAALGPAWPAFPIGTGGETALPAPPTESEAIEVTSRS